MIKVLKKCVFARTRAAVYVHMCVNENEAIYQEISYIKGVFNGNSRWQFSTRNVRKSLNFFAQEYFNNQNLLLKMAEKSSYIKLLNII